MSSPPENREPRRSESAEPHGTPKLPPSGGCSSERLGFFRTIAALWALLKGYAANDLIRIKEAKVREVEAKTDKIVAESMLRWTRAVKTLAEALRTLGAGGKSVELDETQLRDHLQNGAREFPEDPVINAVVNEFLDVPTRTGRERRSDTRYPLSGRVHVSSDKNMPGMVGDCRDVSEGGFYVVVSGDSSLTIGQDTEVWLEDTDRALPSLAWLGQRRPGKIVRTERPKAHSGAANDVGIAIEFERSLDTSQ